MFFVVIKLIFAVIGFIFSVYYGVNAVEIFAQHENKHVKLSDIYSRPFKFHQIWINFFGQLLGWTAWYLVLFYWKELVLLDWPVVVAVFFVGITGVMGFLPHIVSQGKLK